MRISNSLNTRGAVWEIKAVRDRFGYQGGLVVTSFTISVCAEGYGHNQIRMYPPGVYEIEDGIKQTVHDPQSPVKF
jgi:hypothetical protein